MAITALVSETDLSLTCFFKILSQQVYLNYSMKFSNSGRSAKSKHLGQNLSTSTPSLPIRHLSVLHSPYLLVRLWLLLKWLTICWGSKEENSMSLILVVHLKSKSLENLSGFSTQPLQTNECLSWWYPPLTMKTLLSVPMFFFQVARSRNFSFPFYSSVSSELSESLFPFLGSLLANLYPMLLSCQLLNGLCLYRYLYFPLSRQCFWSLSQASGCSRLVGPLNTFTEFVCNCRLSSFLCPQRVITLIGEQRKYAQMWAHSNTIPSDILVLESDVLIVLVG